MHRTLTQADAQSKDMSGNDPTETLPDTRNKKVQATKALLVVWTLRIKGNEMIKKSQKYSGHSSEKDKKKKALHSKVRHATSFNPHSTLIQPSFNPQR